MVFSDWPTGPARAPLQDWNVRGNLTLGTAGRFARVLDFAPPLRGQSPAAISHRSRESAASCGRGSLSSLSDDASLARFQAVPMADERKFERRAQHPARVPACTLDGEPGAPEPLTIGPETPPLARPVCTLVPLPSAGSLAMRGVPPSMPEVEVPAPVLLLPVPTVSVVPRVVVVPACDVVAQPERPPELVAEGCVPPGTAELPGTAGAETIGGDPLDPGVVPAIGGGATALGL